MRIFRFSFIVLVVALAAGCAHRGGSNSPALSSSAILYSKYNIHVAGDAHGRLVASYANYVMPPPPHLILAPGTPLKLTPYKHGFLIHTDDGKEIVFDYHPGRMGMSREDYVELIFSHEPVSLDGYSELDKQGINKGEALVGMSKDGVMAALGYPAAHKTPSLSMDTWVYWKNRYGTVAVEFENGKVSNVRM